MGELDRAHQGAAGLASTSPPPAPAACRIWPAELFKLTAKIDIVHVPYRGAAPAMNDLLGQQVRMTFLDLPVTPAADQGRHAAADRARRPRTRPDRARRADHGGGRDARSDHRELVRHGRACRNADGDHRELNKLATEAMADPAVKAKLAEQDLTLVGDTPEHFHDFIAADIQEMGEGDSRTPAW